MRDSTLRLMLRQLTQLEQTFAMVIFLPVTKIISFAFWNRIFFCHHLLSYPGIISYLFLDEIASVVSKHHRLIPAVRSHTSSKTYRYGTRYEV